MRGVSQLPPNARIIERQRRHYGDDVRWRIRGVLYPAMDGDRLQISKMYSLT